MPKHSLHLATMEKLLKNNGAERVSDEAKAAMAEVLEEFAKEVAERATRYAMHAGRKTVKAEDVKFAVKREY